MSGTVTGSGLTGANGALEFGRMAAETSATGRVLGRAKGLPDQAGDREKIKQLARDFESIFTGIMLKSMRDSVQKSGLIDGGNAEDIYSSLLDAEYSKLMATQGSPGLAKTIERYLKDSMGIRDLPDQARQAGLKAYGAEASGKWTPDARRATMKSEP